MSNKFSGADNDVNARINDMIERFHGHLSICKIDALFIFSDKPEQVLTHQGYMAAAIVRIVPLRDRAAGLSDAMIVFDRFVWANFSAEQRDALVDHELTHLLLDIDGHGLIQRDCLGRPKLQMRPHDRQFGWFDDVARRHGEHSTEIQQARTLCEETGQLYLEFTGKTPALGGKKKPKSDVKITIGTRDKSVSMTSDEFDKASKRIARGIQ